MWERFFAQVFLANQHFTHIQLRGRTIIAQVAKFCISRKFKIGKSSIYYEAMRFVYSIKSNNLKLPIWDVTRIFNNRRNLDASILILAEEEVMAGSFEGTKNKL